MKKVVFLGEKTVGSTFCVTYGRDVIHGICTERFKDNSERECYVIEMNENSFISFVGLPKALEHNEEYYYPQPIEKKSTRTRSPMCSPQDGRRI